MQGLFWLALIFGLIAIAAGVTWATARHSQRAADTKAADAAEPGTAAPPPRQTRDGYAQEYSRPQASRAERYASQAEAANRTRYWAKIVTLAMAAATVLTMFFCSFWIVGTQNVGIVRSFGKPVGVVANGPQWTAPWETVTDMDYSVQVTDFTASGCQIQLRLADYQTACPKISVRWQINTRDADNLFRQFKGSTGGVENGVLVPALQKYANIVFSGYDPVKALSSPDPVGSKGNPSTSQLADQVEKILTTVIGKHVQIDLLSIPNIAYAKNVQDRINAILGQKAQTLIAQQSELTAQAQAAANQAIAASIRHDPNVLTSRCLDLMQEMIKNGQAPTIGMCNFGGSGNGVIVSTGK